MTNEEFNRLPMLLRRAHVLACGIPAHALRGLRFPIKHGQAQVPDGRIGALQGLPGRGRTKGQGQYLYRKCDVAAICGFKMR